MNEAKQASKANESTHERPKVLEKFANPVCEEAFFWLQDVGVLVEDFISALKDQRFFSKSASSSIWAN